ncbi:MAG: serine hydrolase domain-containing protein [Bacteroidales bacterium]|jgi:CubicO group peptidase (beta-lactamase class C family)|nr:serine hydrolase domain-containing protein [Bacteroidales bacterium]
MPPKKILTFCLLLLFFLMQCTISHRVQKHPGKLIHGTVKAGFEGVKEAFVENFTERGDYGAACAIYYKGEKVVDLWGGYKNSITKEPWEEDTKVVVFSTTKGLAAMALAMAHSRGWLDYREKVSVYWPEFAQQGKEDITVRQLLAHEAGLCLVDEKFEITDLRDFDYIAGIMARQEPLWEPGQKHGYHLATMGMYMNELMRRVDPQKRTIGRFFAEEMAKPLGLDFYIGLPDSVPDSELAKVILPSAWQVVTTYDEIPKKMRKDFRNRNSILYQSFKIPEKFNPNSRVTLSVEMPSANGVGDARSIAKLYSEFALGAKSLELKEKTFGLLTRDAEVPPEGAFDIVMGLDTYFSFGFLKPGPDLMFGSSRSAFGTPGAGGSFGFADPDKEIGYAYIMTKMGAYLVNDPREMAIRNAMYRCIDKIEKQNPNYQ